MIGFNTRKLSLIAATGMILTASPASFNAAQAAEIGYISGGIGKASQMQMDAVKAQYNTHLLFADASGAYLADVGVKVTDEKGNVVLSQVSDGPYLYLQLPDGVYTITARYQGVDKMQKMGVSKHKARDRVVFTWENALGQHAAQDTTRQ